MGKGLLQKNYCPVSLLLTADLLIVASDRIARAFDIFWATRVIAPDISKALHRVWQAQLFHKLMEVLWNFRSDIWPYFFFSQKQIALGGSGLKIFTIIPRYWSSTSRVHSLSYAFHKNINDFLNLICNIAIYTDDTTL